MPQAIGNDRATKFKMPRQLKPVGAFPCAAACEDLIDDAHDKGACDQSQYHANYAGDQRVGGTLEHEHLDQMPAPCADSPGHPQLRAPRRCQHHKDQEYEQYPNHDGKQAEQDEETGYDASYLFRRLQQAALYVDNQELGHCYNEGVDLAGQFLVAGFSYSLEELGANAVVGEE